MGQIVAIFKGISALKKMIDKFYRAWVAYDIKRIRQDYAQKTKEQIEILEAIDRASKRRDEETIKHLMRQYDALDRLPDDSSEEAGPA